MDVLQDASDVSKLTSMASTEEIAHQILERRKSLIGDLFEGPLGRELVKLDAAYKALTGSEPPSVAEVFGGRQIVKQVDEKVHVGDAVEVEKVPVPVKSAARDLMAKSDRTWTYDAMLKYWETQGVHFDVKNLRDALRTAILQLMNEGLVERVDRGVYRPINDVWERGGESQEHPVDEAGGTS